MLSADGRASPTLIDALLAEDFREIGSSGDTFGKREALDLLAEEACDGHVYERATSDWSIRALTADVALVTYRVVRRDHTEGATAASLRSSVWRFRDGGWRMVFHQGTRVGAP